ncbi:internalin, partial [Bifidobacterium margollesii]
MNRSMRRGLTAVLASLAMIVTVALAPAVGAHAAEDWSKGLTQAQINSSYGFAKWVSVTAKSEDERADARRAVAVLDRFMRDDPSYTKLGADGDATSLANTRKALQEDVKSNQFRATLTNEPCRMDLPAGKGRRCNDPNKRLAAQQLNMQLLLSEQFIANAVRATGGHWGGGDAQNLTTTWNNGGFRDFYDGNNGRVDNEKVNYERDMTDGKLDGKAADGSWVGETGHYTTYVNGNWSQIHQRYNEYVYATIAISNTVYAQNYYSKTSGSVNDPYMPGWGFPNDILPEDGEYISNQNMTLPENLLEKFDQYMALLDASTTYTVSFDPAGGTTVPTQTVKKNAKASQPADPTRSGYSFAGWFNGNTRYDFNTPVTGNLKLVAHWTANTVYRTVSFDSAGGTAVTSQKVVDGSRAVQPKAPTRSGYSFTGWYNGNAKWDFNTPVTSDLKLTARWTAIPPQTVYRTVSFDSAGGSAVASQRVANGSRAVQPK